MGGNPYPVPVTVAALLLVAGAAVLHAGWNALVKRAGDPVLFLWWVGVVASVLYAPIARGLGVALVPVAALAADRAGVARIRALAR